MKKLCDIEVGKEIMVECLEAKGLLRERLLALGFTKGAPIEVIRKGPGNNLTAFKVRDTIIALRKEESDLIHVLALDKVC